MPSPAAPLETDALIVGAGPVGLFQVFELGLLEIGAHVVDSLPYPGGQCVELYGDKPIYDIPALSVCTGRELVERLLKQIEPFGAGFHLGEVVSSVQQQPDGRFLVGTSKGSTFLARTVFIAAGVGAFLPRKLKVEGIEKFEGTQLFHRAAELPQDIASGGKRLVVLGDEDVAVAAALDLHARADVTLIHRRDAFRAEPDLVANMRDRVAAGAMRFMAGQITGFNEASGRLVSLQVTDPEGVTHDVEADAVLVSLGLSPKLGPIAEWGLDIERKQVRVDTEQFSTSVPGIFAVGDINTYPGKKKLILCGFHECTLAAFGAAAIVFPQQKTLLQYTTTSPRLHKLLGVQVPTVE